MAASPMLSCTPQLLFAAGRRRDARGAAGSAPAIWAWRRWRSPTTTGCTPRSEFAVAARERAIHPIIGAELTLEDERHLVLLAENDAGYRNLCRLISRAQLDGEKERARLAWRHLQGQTEGLIALTGCRQGVLAAPLLRRATGRAPAARWRSCAELFPGRLYVELQHHLHPDDDALVDALAELGPRGAPAPGGHQQRALCAARGPPPAGCAHRHPPQQPAARMSQPPVSQLGVVPQVARRDGGALCRLPRGAGQHARDRRALPGDARFPRRRPSRPCPRRGHAR